MHVADAASLSYFATDEFQSILCWTCGTCRKGEMIVCKESDEIAGLATEQVRQGGRWYRGHTALCPSHHGKAGTFGAVKTILYNPSPCVIERPYAVDLGRKMY